MLQIVSCFVFCDAFGVPENDYRNLTFIDKFFYHSSKAANTIRATETK
jgi:hypothetical protein